MMYVQYPEYPRAEQLANLERLNLSECCIVPDDLSGGLELSGAIVESFLGDPILRFYSSSQYWAANLTNGQSIFEIDSDHARSVVERQSDATVSQYATIERDQWTVAGGYDRHRPLYRFAIDDDIATEVYVSGTTGEVVLKTTGNDRFWNWMGSVIHWIYPMWLRSHVQAWSQLVIWLSIVATFLTLTGLYAGIDRLRRAGRSSYRGWLLWHHYLGLVFGIFMLAWIVSGLLSMTPFGALSGRDFSSERDNIRGRKMTLDHVISNLYLINQQLIPPDTVRLTASEFAGEFAWIAWNSAEQSVRLGNTITTTQLSMQANFARPLKPILSMGTITESDNYYYSHHRDRRFPVFRIVYQDGERLYLDKVSGDLVSGIDADRRWSRWLFHGLHRGDFAAWARKRPVWDMLMLFLMSGVTLGALTGGIVACKRASRWLAARTTVQKTY